MVQQIIYLGNYPKEWKTAEKHYLKNIESENLDWFGYIKLLVYIIV